MSEETRPVPPFPPAELEFSGGATNDPRRPGPEYNNRWFIIRDGIGYWRNSDGGEPDGYVASRKEAGVWKGEKISPWNIGAGIMELLPLPQPLIITAADRDIKFGGLGKVGLSRLCILKNNEGQYVDGNLQPVAERALATIQRVDKLYAMDIVRPFTFELLVPADADTGGPEVQFTVKFAEAQRDTDAARFLVKYVAAEEVTGYSYFSSVGSRSNRAKAFVMDKKSLRRYFDDVKKELIVIELLKPMPLSKITDFFSKDAIELIKTAFKSEPIRGFMLSKLKVMPPAELDTFEKLQGWIEWNVGKVSTGGSTEITLDPLVVQEAPRTVEDVSMEIEVKRSRRAYGRCKFYRTEWGTDQAPITLVRLRELAEGAANYVTLRRAVLTECIEASDDCDYENKEDESLEDYQTDDTDDHETTWRDGTSGVDALIKAFMRQHLPEQLTRLERGT